LRTQLLTLKPDKEQAFAEDILAFASRKFNASMTKGWTTMVQHVANTARWKDLYKVTRYTGQDPFTWPNCHAWSTAWDEPAAGGWVHATSLARRRQLATRIELTDFDPMITVEKV
jgi:hypothetical protein